MDSILLTKIENSSYMSYIQMRFKLDINIEQVHSELKIVNEDVLTI